MKKSILILAITFLVGMFVACNKDKAIAPTPTPATPQTLFTGVVFIQLKTDSLNLYTYGVHRVVSPTIIDSLYPLHAWIGHSTNTKDSVSLPFQSGDSLVIGAYKDDEPTNLYTTNLNVLMRTKVYLNGVVIYDTTSVGGQYWFPRLP